MSDPLKPTPGILCKLGSIAVHVAELLSADGHAFDRNALDVLMKNEDVLEWLVGMDRLGLLPKKRSAQLAAPSKRSKK